MAVIQHAAERLGLLRQREQDLDATLSERQHVAQEITAAERELKVTAKRADEARATFRQARIHELELTIQFYESAALAAEAGRAATEAREVTLEVAMVVMSLTGERPKTEPPGPHGASRVLGVAQAAGLAERPDGCFVPDAQLVKHARAELAALRAER